MEPRASSKSPKSEHGNPDPRGSLGGSLVKAEPDDAPTRPQASQRLSQHKRPADRDASHESPSGPNNYRLQRPDHKRHKSPTASVSDGYASPPVSTHLPPPTTAPAFPGVSGAVPQLSPDDPSPSGAARNTRGRSIHDSASTQAAAATGTPTNTSRPPAGLPPANHGQPQPGQARRTPQRPGVSSASTATPGSRRPVAANPSALASRSNRSRGSASTPVSFAPSALPAPGQHTATTTPRALPPLSGASRGHPPSSGSFPASARRDTVPQRYPGIELQPETRPISLAQLVNEVKGIYVGLVMVESKCIEIDNDQGAAGDALNKLNDEQWQALIALHRTLLHEHHDFMLASQHPSASLALRRLAQKYAMPARMWRHGIHSFLELLRHRLPASREHMITFIYLAYSMMALLYETVPAFEDTWVECLGDLSRYRMAIEDDNQRVRDTWTGVSRHWYTVASDRAPTTGRLFHHLAILARPSVVTQLYFYSKSLCVPIPFTSTRESILTLFDPILHGAPPRSVPQIDIDFATAHAILFTGQSHDQFDTAAAKYLDALGVHIVRTAKGWIETGAHTAIVNCCSMLQYGEEDNYLMKLLQRSIRDSIADEDDNNDDNDDDDVSMTDASNNRQASAEARALDALARPQRLATETDKVVLSLNGNPSCNGYIHVRLVWMLTMAGLPDAIGLLQDAFLWNELADLLNLMMASYTTYGRIERDTLPQLADEKTTIKGTGKDEKSERKPLTQEGGAEESAPQVKTEPKTAQGTPVTEIRPPLRSDTKPLPEDWALRGLSWASDVFPRDWFDNVDTMDDDDRFMETASMSELRKERILWLAWKLAKYEKWLLYRDHQFSVAEAFDLAADGYNDAVMDDLDESGDGLVKIERVEDDIKCE